MQYIDYIKKQDICDHRREYLHKSIEYVDEHLDIPFRDEIFFIHKELLSGDYYQSVN